MRIRGVQIGDHEMKRISFPGDTTTYLLRDINYHTRIQSILKSQKVLAQKQTFEKFRPYEL